MNTYLFVFLLMFVTLACGDKSKSMSNEEKIAGEVEKRWKASKETNAAGSIDKLTRDEKRQSITFSRNGSVRMGDGEQMMSGMWSLEGTTLRMQFTGSTVSENFTVLDLSDDEMKLRAGDGSEMVMKVDD